MNDPTSILEQDKRRIDAAGKRGAIVRRVRGSVCVLVLIALFLTVGVGGGPGSDNDATQVRIPPTVNIEPTATLSPEPNADGSKRDAAQVTSLARFKAH
jgi:hypothetical protein